MSIINIKQIAETVIELSHESERNKKEIINSGDTWGICAYPRKSS